MNSGLRLQATLLILTLSGCASQTAVPMKTIYIPAGAEAIYDKYRYAPAIRTGDMVILSGIPASGPGSYEDKVRRMFERVKSTLALAGGDMSDIVEITTFHSGPKDTAAFDDEFARFLQIHAEYFPKGKYPAWTAIGNAVLLSPGAVVEMRVVAIIGSGAHFQVNHAAAPEAASQH